MERKTKQSEAIWQCIEDAGRPLSPPEITTAARCKVPQLGVATVYRAIKRLVKEGKVVPVVLPGEPARYELAGLTHHHHFYCKRCGRVFELEGCLLKQDLHAPKGYVIEDHEITLYGTCPPCGRSRSLTP
jgi:Fur family ferric uptake transcriptional regulator